MNSLNSVLLEGNLTRDAEVRVVGNGNTVVTFSIASNRYFKRDEDTQFQSETSYFDIEQWGTPAERNRNKLLKGVGVRIVGRFKQNRWTDQEGKNHSKIIFVAENVEFKTKFDKEPPQIKEEGGQEEPSF